MANSNSPKELLKFGRRVEKSTQYPVGWKKIYRSGNKYGNSVFDEENLLGHKSVVCFPGNMAFQAEDMNGYCKQIEYMLKNAGILPDDMPHIYSVGYSAENNADVDRHRLQLLEQSGSVHYGLGKEYVRDYWSPFFNAYILPLVQSEDGQPRPISESIQNLQNVTFVTHCHGSMFAQQMEQLLYEKVKEFYPGKEKEVMSNVRMMHFASRKEIDQKTGVKHFNVVSLADEMYADYNVLAEDNIHKLLQKQSIDDRSAIIPVNDNETIMVFKELSTPKTYTNRDRDDHSLVMAIVSGREMGKNGDEEFLANEPALSFVRSMLRHFVEHPEDTRTMKDMMSGIDKDFLAKNLQSGQEVISGMSEAKHFDKSLLDFLSQYTLTEVGGDAHLYLQKNADGKYFYEQMKEQAQKTGDFTSFRSLLKKVKGNLSFEIVLQEINDAIQRRDRSALDMLTHGMSALGISRKILNVAKPDDLAFLYPEMKKSHLSDASQRDVLDGLLEKSKRIKNEGDKIRIQRYLKQEKEKSEAKKVVRIEHAIFTR